MDQILKNTIIRAIIGAAIVLLFTPLYKKQKAKKEQKLKEKWEAEQQAKEQHYTQEPKPGSAEHYEKWKAERENREP